MKKNLIIKYMAKKLANANKAAAEMKRVFGDECYLEMLSENLVSDLPPKFKSDMEKFLRKRFGFKKHKCVFMTPTVRQWVADLTGEFSEDDIYGVFVQRSGVSDELIRTKRYADNILNVPFVVDIVDMLEEATGKELKDRGYLTNDDAFAYADIAKFFATV